MANALTGKTPKTFSLWKVLLPVLIGLGVVAIMFWNDARSQNLWVELSQISFSRRVIGFLLLAWLFMLGRDLGLSMRFRLLTDKDLKWTQAIRVNFLCEFTSAVTPTAFGGSTMGMLYLNREGIEGGRATTLMMTTLIMDELFLVIACPIIVLITPIGQLFDVAEQSFGTGARVTFWLIYTGIALWTLILFIGVMHRPHLIGKVLHHVFRLPLLRKYQAKIDNVGVNIISTSHDLRGRTFGFWIKLFGATVLSWCSRYMVVNALFLAFVPDSGSMQWVIFARQFIVWVMLTVSPTPGGAGLSEWLFTSFYGAIIPTAALALVMAMCWRIISYYVYLAIGVSILPRWIKTKF